MVMHKVSATPREAGAVQAILLMLAALLPIMGTLTMLPVMPLLFGHFAAQPHAQLLVPMIITIPAVSMALLAPLAGERVGDVSNVLFSNGWIADDDGTVYIYYASSDTRMHVAVSTVDRLVDYCLHTPADGLRSAASVAAVNALIDRNEAFLNG
mgnify:CR=1 FL=1